MALGIFSFVAFCYCYFAFVLFFTDIFDTPDPVDLTASTFDKYVGEHAYVLVMFYASWCKYCKEFFPHFEKVVQAQYDVDAPHTLSFAYVDGPNEKDLSAKYVKEGYPTVILFIGGVAVEYEGERESGELTAWVREKVERKAVNIRSPAQLAAVQQSVPFLAVFSATRSDAQTARLLDKFLLAQKFIDAQYANFGVVLDESVKLPGQITVFAADSDTSALSAHVLKDVSDSVSLEDLVQRIDNASFPIVMLPTPRATARVAKYAFSTLILFANTSLQANEEEGVPSDSDKARSREYLYGHLLAAAQDDLHARVLYMYADIAENDENAEQLDKFDIGEYRLPLLLLVQFTQDRLLRFVDRASEGTAITAHAVAAFVDAWHDKKVRPVLSSQPIPASDDEEDATESCTVRATPRVREIVGENYAQVTATCVQRPVLVEFYSPECAYCQQFEPVYEELAHAVQGKVLLTRINGDENEVEDFSVSAFPALYLYTHDGTREIIEKYEGKSRTVSDLLAFIELHTGLKF